MKNPRVENIPVPKDWYAIGFDDSKWPNAREFTEEEVGPKNRSLNMILTVRSSSGPTT
jgi:hypothetical protein